ncbi:peptidase M23B [Desulforamulus reducens MI-1]|uniref:Peptidase M23B n=1 Tax=Desulforamulus reducens (strain ATCC BAA-1160 / DSM 100696 / MI-1) TaxID=349161 RepID=A4J995_DESRM|nr:M23 family metallopeptidase [Desulforamulus reducens]ABO51648.1 peptidase M23B [Desulforamulus reducens MI-1]
MWPFENSLRNQLRNQDLIKKYREWLRKWLLKGNSKFNSTALVALVVVAALLSAYGLYSWHSGQILKDTVTNPKSNQVMQKHSQQAPATCQLAKAKEEKDPVQKETQEITVPAAVNPEEMVKPVMGHVLTGVGMTFSEVFKDYRYSTGVALAAEPGTEVKAALAGTVSLVSSGDKGTMVVSINHGNGWQATYGGLGQVQVKAGQKIEKNQTLGTLGEHSRTNGVLENHLYFKITKNGKPVDPNIYWK